MSQGMKVPLSALRQPTQRELRKDAESIVQQVYRAWQGDVEVTVILTPRRNTAASMQAVWCSSLPPENARPIMRQVGEGAAPGGVIVPPPPGLKVT